MRNLIAGGLFLIAAYMGSSGGGSKHEATRPEDRIVKVSTDDVVVNAAKDQGRSSADQFLRRLQNPAATESDFSIKFDLTHQGGHGDQAELIWASELKYTDGKLSGRLADEPYTAGYKFGQRVDIDRKDIVDWAIKVDGKYEGHFTTRALMKQMSPEEAAQVKKFLGW